MLQTKLLRHLIASFIVFSTNTYAITLADLTNREWILIALSGRKVATTLYKDEKPNIKFVDNTKFSAWAGCNKLNGSYTFTQPDALQFAPSLISTKMSCAGFYNIEDPFLDMLASVVKVKFEAEKLQFLDKQNKVVSEFITITTL